MNERTNEHGVRVSDLNLFTYMYTDPTEEKREKKRKAQQQRISTI